MSVGEPGVESRFGAGANQGGKPFGKRDRCYHAGFRLPESLKEPLFFVRPLITTVGNGKGKSSGRGKVSHRRRDRLAGMGNPARTKPPILLRQALDCFSDGTVAAGIALRPQVSEQRLGIGYATLLHAFADLIAKRIEWTRSRNTFEGRTPDRTFFPADVFLNGPKVEPKRLGNLPERNPIAMLLTDAVEPFLSPCPFPDNRLLFRSGELGGCGIGSWPAFIIGFGSSISFPILFWLVQLSKWLPNRG